MLLLCKSNFPFDTRFGKSCGEFAFAFRQAAAFCFGGEGGRRKQKGRKPGLVCGREVEQWLLSHLPAQTKPRKKQEGVLAAAGGEHCLGHGNDSR